MAFVLLWIDCLNGWTARDDPRRADSTALAVADHPYIVPTISTAFALTHTHFSHDLDALNNLLLCIPEGLTSARNWCDECDQIGVAKDFSFVVLGSIFVFQVLVFLKYRFGASPDPLPGQVFETSEEEEDQAGEAHNCGHPGPAWQTKIRNR